MEMKSFLNNKILIFLYGLFLFFIFLTVVLHEVLPAIIHYYFPYGIYYRFVFNALIVLICFMISYKGKKLYEQSGKKEFILISTGFLAGALLKLFEIPLIINYILGVTFQVTSHIIFVLLGDIIIPLCLFFAVFLSKKTGDKIVNQERKLYIIAIIYPLVVFTTDYLFSNYLLGFTYKVLPNLFLVKTIEQALCFLALMIFLDMKIINRQRICSKFIFGLLLLAFGPFLIVQGVVTTIYAFALPIFKIIGYSLIYSGLNELKDKSGVLYFRQKLSAYLCLFVLFLYVAIISICTLVLGVRFPLYSSSLFLFCFLSLVIVQYHISIEFSAPVLGLINNVNSFQTGVKPAFIPVVSNDEIGILSDIMNKIFSLNWKYTQALKKKQKDIMAFYNREKLVQKIINSTRNSLDIQKISRDVCCELAKLFDVERVCLIRFSSPDNYKEFSVEQEYRNSEFVKTSNNLVGLCNVIEYLGLEILKKGVLLKIDDVEKSDTPEFFKDIYKELGVKSLMGFGIKNDEKEWGVLLLSKVGVCKHWRKDDERLLKTISDQMFLAITQAELYKSLGKQIEREKLIKKAVDIVRSSCSTKESLEMFTELVGKYYKADRCFIRCFDKKINQFVNPDKDIQYLADSDVIDLTTVVQDVEGIGYFLDEYRRQGGDFVMSDTERYIKDNNLEGSPVERYLLGVGIKSDYPFVFWEDENELIYFVIHYTKKAVILSNEELASLKVLTTQVGSAYKQGLLYKETQKIAKRETFLRQLLTEITKAKDTNEVVDICCDEIQKYFNVQRVSILHFPDYEAKKYLKWEVIKEVKDKQERVGVFDVEIDPRIGEWWGDKFMKLGKSYCLENIPDADISSFMREAYLKMGLKILVGVPIKRFGKYWGAIFLSSYTEPSNWADEDIEVLEEIADQIFQAIEQFKSYETIKKQADAEKILRETIELTRSTFDKVVIKQMFVKLIGEFFKANRVLFFEYDSNISMYSPVKEGAEYLSSKDEVSFVGYDWSLIENEQYIQPLLNKQELNIISLEEYLQEQEKNQGFIDLFKDSNVKSSYNIPVVYGDDLLGCFCIEYTIEERKFNNEELDFIRSICKQFGIAFYQACQYEKIKKIAENERIVKEIALETRVSQTPEDAYRHILKRISKIYSVNRVLFVDVPSESPNNSFVKYEYREEQKLKRMEGSPYPYNSLYNVLKDEDSTKPYVLNSTDEIRKNLELRSFCDEYSIKSILMVPMKRFDKEMTVLGVLILASEEERVWEYNEAELFGLITNSLVNVIWEIMKRIELDEVRDFFVMTLAHDLQVPLIGEATAIEFLQSSSDDTTVKEFREILDELLVNNNQVQKMLNSLMRIYNYELSRINLIVEEANLVTLLEETCAEFYKEVEAKNIKMKTVVKNNIPLLSFDTKEVKEVMHTMIENAIDNAPKFGNVDINIQQQENEVIVCVKDNGPSISEDKQKILFEKYAMAKEIARKIGAGFGLYLSKLIIKAHNGRLFVESANGEGSVFCFTLPIK